MPTRLSGCRIYLAGTMEHATDAGTTWRKEITPRLEALGLRVFDPTNRPCHLSFSNSVAEETVIMRKTRADGNYDLLSTYMQEIVHQDLRMVDISDIILVYVNADVPTVGTIDEFVTASNQRKPILISCTQGLTKMPLWFWGRIGHNWKYYMHESLEDCVLKLEKIASCSDQELATIMDPKRWLFLKPERGTQDAVHTS